MAIPRCVTDNQWLIGIIEHPFDLVGVDDFVSELAKY
jgi:hypothetical protein